MSQSGDQEETFGLPELFLALRNDLVKAQQNLQGEQGLLKIEEAEVEVSFTASRETGAEGGLNLKVFGVGASGGGKRSKTDATVQRLTVKLVPGADAGEWFLAGSLPAGSEEQPRAE